MWAYDTRDALDLSVEAAVAALPTHYHPATLRKVEGGSARPGTRMWRELGNLYVRLADERHMAIDPQPKLVPDALEATESPADLIAAIQAQTRAINELVAVVREGQDDRDGLLRALAVVVSRLVGQDGAALPERSAPRG